MVGVSSLPLILHSCMNTLNFPPQRSASPVEGFDYGSWHSFGGRGGCGPVSVVVLVGALSCATDIF